MAGSDVYASAKAAGLGALGVQAQIDCAIFSPGPGSDPLQVQACAAINFLTVRCITPSSGEAAILKGQGVSAVSAGNCTGTYGQGQQLLNGSALVSRSDPIFTPIQAARLSAGKTTSGQVCSTQDVVTKPATYATSTCLTSTD